MSSQLRRRRRSLTRAHGGAANASPSGGGNTPGDNEAEDLLPDIPLGYAKTSAVSLTYASVDLGDECTGIAIAVAGTGYVIGELLTVVGGTGTATIAEVTEVSGAGGVLRAIVSTAGLYSANPSNDVATTTAESGADCTLTLTLTERQADTIVRGAGSFLTDGWLVGMKLKITGTASNDDVVTVATVVALTITCRERDTLAAETVSSTLSSLQQVPGDNPG